MTEKRSIIEACEASVECTPNRQLKKIQIEIATSSRVGCQEELVDLLTEANSIIDFICAEDNDLYEQYHYRLFLGEDGKLFVIQARELDVENYPNERPNDQD